MVPGVRRGGEARLAVWGGGNNKLNLLIIFNVTASLHREPFFRESREACPGRCQMLISMFSWGQAWESQRMRGWEGVGEPKAAEAGERASVFSEHRALCRNCKDFCKTTLDVP